jgi:hypothetical protein
MLLMAFNEANPEFFHEMSYNDVEQRNAETESSNI